MGSWICTGYQSKWSLVQMPRCPFCDQLTDLQAYCPSDRSYTGHTDHSDLSSSLGLNYTRQADATAPVCSQPTHASPWQYAEDPTADYDEIDYLPHSGSSSYTSLPSLTDTAVEFEPRSLEYPLAPKCESQGWMEDPLTVPDYGTEDELYGLPMYRQGAEEKECLMSRMEVTVEEATIKVGGLRSPWFANDVEEAERFLVKAGRDVLTEKETRLREMRRMAGGTGVVGLGF
jgi:hypothetical protein